MITVNFYKNGFVASGHAEYDDYGRDIVCAAVSAITVGALNWFDEYDTNIRTSGEANVAIVINNYDNETFKLLGLIYTQLRAIESNPEYRPFLKINFNESFLKGERNNGN